MKQEIIKLLSEKIQGAYNITLDEITLENPPKKELGDYAFGCFVLSKELKKNPVHIAQEISELLGVEKIIESASVAGPYINIRVNKTLFTQKFLQYSLKGYNNIGDEKNREKTIYIDYIGCNVGKPLHIGHMCSPNQGQVMINVYKKLGYTVVSDSHIGDWGIIFGKLITAFKKYGNNDKLQENAVEHLLELYIKITQDSESDEGLDENFREAFKKLSSGNKESVKLWRKFTKESIMAMSKQLERLNVQPDFNIGESFYEGLNLPKMEEYPDLEFSMKDIVSELIEKKIATQNDDGSVGIVFSDESKIPSCILQKRDGTHLYLASDLGAIKYRMHNWNPEKIIYFTDMRQQLHFRQVFEISKQAEWLDSPQSVLANDGKITKLFHAYNGFISLKDGAMSTRKGKIIKLGKLLDESEIRAEKIIGEKRDDIQGKELKNIAKIIGIGAIKYGYLKKNRESDSIFDWDEFMSFEGNSGPYIQYAYVRAKRILEKEHCTENILAEFLGENGFNAIGNEVFFSTDSEIDLAKKIMNFHNILEASIEGNYPHIITGYTYELTKAFSHFYNNVRVKDEENESNKKLKLLLVSQFTYILKETFDILGIQMPEKM